MTYGEAREFLSKHTQLVELTGDDARIAVAPQYQGRVMTSSCDGLDGMSFGFINRDFIAAGQKNPHFNNYGGEERLWISPEGGQFSLWFKPGVKNQTLADWYTPPELNDGDWPVVSRSDDASVHMAKRMKMQNNSGAMFDLDIVRTVRLLSTGDCREVLGDAALETMTTSGAKTVAYETSNNVANRGQAMCKEQGLVSIWMLGMFNAGEQSVILVPYKSGDSARLGPVVQSDYFGKVPAERLKTLPEAVLFRADGRFRSKIGTSQHRAKNIVGSIDFQANVLTLVKFSMPDDSEKHLYISNLWGGPHAHPYIGDVMNCYNDGPPEPGQAGMGAFYELESLSPAKELKTAESLTHNNITVHIRADIDILSKLAEEILGVDLEKVRREMFG
jgi:hypothetical protein